MNRIIKRSIFTSASGRMPEYSKLVAGRYAKHPAGGMDLWRKFALFGALPCVGLMSAFVLLGASHGHEQPKEYIEYEYLRKRDKRFPWGDGTRSLFHNPRVNYHPEDWGKYH